MSTDESLRKVRVTKFGFKALLTCLQLRVLLFSIHISPSATLAFQRLVVETAGTPALGLKLLDVSTRVESTVSMIANSVKLRQVRTSWPLATLCTN
jgi:hypothetical protein